MIQITVPAIEFWDEANQQFINTKECTLQLEHSLVSISKWESKWGKPFILKKTPQGDDEKTHDEIIDYIKCMTITQNVDEEVYSRLSKENIEQINKYISAPMTATSFSNNKQGAGSNEQITSELIYYWMITLQIPFECQKWHLNRLLTLIRICNIKNQPPKKMNRRDVMSRNAALNAKRRAELNSNG